MVWINISRKCVVELRWEMGTRCGAGGWRRDGCENGWIKKLRNNLRIGEGNPEVLRVTAAYDDRIYFFCKTKLFLKNNKKQIYY